VMDRPTCVRSLDVRVQGIAGGSLPRVRGRKISDVGPRSAHIAGLPYASLAGADSGPLEVELIAPRAGDPADYAVVKAASGQVFALTLTCAANALGLVPEGAYAAGSREAALRGFEALGRALGCDAPSAARQMLNLAAKRVAEAVEELANEYKLRRHAFQLIGGGGGAGALVPAVAERLGVPFRLAEHAEVISSLGDALASAREVVERSMESGLSVETLAREAEAAVLRSGAEAESVQVVIERDEERGLVRAVATGSVALLAAGVHTQIDEPVARSLAAQTANGGALELLCDTDGFWVYQVKGGLMRRAQTIAVDRRGLLRLHSGGGKTLAGERELVMTQLRKHLDTLDLVGRQPSVKLLVGARLLDLGASGTAEGMIEAARAAVKVDEETSKRVVVIVE
jgi:N-methylhydantoinase A